MVAFPTPGDLSQGSNLSLLHRWADFYLLSHRGSSLLKVCKNFLKDSVGPLQLCFLFLTPQPLESGQMADLPLNAFPSQALKERILDKRWEEKSVRPQSHHLPVPGLASGQENK